MNARSLRISIVACAAWSTLAAVGVASTWYVDVGNPNAPGTGTQADPYTRIQYAVDRPTTVNGDLLLVAPGTYSEGLSISKGLTIRSTDGPLATMLRGATSSSSVFLNGPEFVPLELEGFSITNYSGAVQPPLRIFTGRLRRCLIYGNGEARNFASTVFVAFDGYLFNCTVAHNYGGGVGNQGVAPGYIYMDSTIVWGNEGVDFNGPGGTFAGQYNLIGTYTFFPPPPGNLIANPIFWSLANDEFHLFWGSPCISAGTPALTDPDGSALDIGAIPYDASYIVTPVRQKKH